MNCNWLGAHASVLAIDWYGNETLHNTPFTNMTINGTPVAAVQNVDNFSFARCMVPDTNWLPSSPKQLWRFSRRLFVRNNFTPSKE
ncbi:hypothetical protein P692DRAFT_201180558 [Suillus brevipes Sb2]|nr:hypothetical protein P692DRAFT_201180558 [Suillus brevipes Sb2]